METATTYDRVVRDMRMAILAGDLAPGRRLLQVELAERFRSSRIPLREALRTLEAEGLVTSEPHRGATVAKLDRDDVAELYAFRLALERVAVRAAAERRADLRPAVAAWAAQARAAVAGKNLSALIEADAAFHAAIAEAGGNRHVRAALDARWSHVARAMRFYLRVDTYAQNAWDEHTAVADAIAAGDADEAERLLAAHLKTSEAVVLRSPALSEG